MAEMKTRSRSKSSRGLAVRAAMSASGARKSQGSVAIAAMEEAQWVKRLHDSLREGLETVGIDAKVQIAPVPATRLYRVTVLARKFRNLSLSERQDLVWRIVNRALQPEEQLHISMILTLSGEEYR